MIRSLVWLLLSFCLASVVQAQIYKWTDAQGRVVFGSEPDEHLNAEPVTLGEPSIYSPTEPGITQVRVKTLHRLNFISPMDKEQPLSPQGELLIEVECSPPFKGEVRYEYLIDGNLVAEDPAPRILLQGLAPGDYRLRVRAFDKAQKPLADTKEIQVHLVQE